MKAAWAAFTWWCWHIFQITGTQVTVGKDMSELGAIALTWTGTGSPLGGILPINCTIMEKKAHGDSGSPTIVNAMLDANRYFVVLLHDEGVCMQLSDI
jgi:hypothetical protein